jgi:5-formyltetrahydrofolate cyclo-ligase
MAARDALDPPARRAFDARITPRLLALLRYREARCVAAYVGFGTEFDTTAFIADVLARGKSLVLPRVERAARSLRLHAVRDLETELAAGVWGIREPRPERCAEVGAAAVDFVLVPGVAFTARCERLGYGGGYYDRLIPGFGGRAFLAAAAYSLQILPQLPLTPADRRVDFVVTEEADYRLPAS